jgi:hypothetical protein
VAVVCAGAKSILDLGLTLEYLETHGVPVIGYGTDVLPAFFTRDSGFALAHRLDNAADIARVMQAQWQLGLSAGLVIANPIPAEHALQRDTVEDAIAATADGWARVPWRLLGDEGEARIAGQGVTVRCLVRADGSVPDTDDPAQEPDLVAVLARAY